MAVVAYAETLSGEGLKVGSGSQSQNRTTGESLSAGTVVETDPTTRARLTFGDAEVVVSHATRLTFAGPELIQLASGRVVVEGGKTALRVETPAGVLAVHEAKASMVVMGDKVQVTVSRGYIEAQGASGNVLVSPGMEITWGKGSEPKTRWSNALGTEIGWSADVSERPADAPRPASGLGKLVGKQPNGERERPLDLVSHKVTARVQGNVAYTEIHEAFRNPTGETLEGLYRFPLPADAQIASLSLKVGDRWMEGEFLETARAEYIFRDVINRWLDPALLKWKQGNQFELRIFPILPRQVREVKIGYVQTLPRASEGYRYTYPMPVDLAGQIPAENFVFDGKFYGVDAASDVSAEGYSASIERGATDGDVPVATVSFDQKNFIAAGDFTVRFARPKDTGVNVYTFDETIRRNEPSYALVTVRPDLADATRTASRDFVVIADTSYSRTGATHALQSEIVGRLVGEVDVQDRVTAMACSSTCRPLGAPAFEAGGTDRAREVAEALGDVVPRGTFNPLEGVRVAERLFNARAGAEQGREAHVIVLTDGAISSGPSNPDALQKAMRAVLGPKNVRLSVVDLGGDTDQNNLNAVALGGGGTVVSVDPGLPPMANALNILRHHYGAVLTDIRVEWPQGVTEQTQPSAVALAPGDELTAAARFSGAVSGDFVVRGQRAGQPFEQRIPLVLSGSTSKANAFVPRKWASMRMADLDLLGDSQRAAIINLSIRYGVLSRYTALLALEDEQMMDDYGVRAQKRAELSADEDAELEAAPSGATRGAEFNPGIGDVTASAPADEKPAAAPMKKSARSIPPPSPAASESAKSASLPYLDDDIIEVNPEEKVEARPRPQTKTMAGRGSGMKHRLPRRPPVRQGEIVNPKDPTSLEIRQKDELQRVFQAEPENRTKRMRYIRALIAAGQADQARREVEQWLTLNAMDAEALVLMAQVLTLDGKVDEALSWLESGADAQPRGNWVHQRLHSAYLSLGLESLQCAQQMLLDNIGRRSAGLDPLSCRLTSDLKLFGLAPDVLVEPTPPEIKRIDGDIKVSWQGSPGVYLVLVESDGRPLSWLSQRRNIRVGGVGLGQQSLVLPSARENATYSVRLVAPNGSAQGQLVVQTRTGKKTFEVQQRRVSEEIAEVRYTYSRWR